MSNLNIEFCPETGICSIVKGSAEKVDLMPGEVIALKNTSGDFEAIRETIAEVAPNFAKGLETEEIQQVVNSLK